MKRRLIDANALIAEYDRVHVGPPGGARKLMEDAPTVDAVEVVRCLNCEFSIPSEYSEHALKCTHWMMDCNKNGFCSYGERRSNVTNLLFADMEEIIDETD